MVLLVMQPANAQTPQTPQTLDSRLEPLPTTGPALNLDYSLQLNHRCVVGSPLIRLRDVATPNGPPSTWWERAGGVVIGMMPIEGGEMVIERDRLTIAIAQDASIPSIAWTGPTTIRIKMVAQQDDHGKISNHAIDPTGRVADMNPSTTNHKSSIALTAATNAQSVNANDLPTSSSTASAKAPVSSDLPPLGSQDADRINRLIQFAIDRDDLSLRDSYDIEIDLEQVGLRTLSEVRRVDRIEFLTPPIEGEISAKIFGMTSRTPVDQTIKVRFIARPMLVVPRESLRRGQTITRGDLILMPAPRGYPIESALTNIDDAVDMQVVNVLQKDRPISPSSITRPVLIERGDLVEVHVVGGGVTVATNARSLSKGAAGDLIAVETLDPRKKVIARVARAGLVEVFTRPPRVR